MSHTDHDAPAPSAPTGLSRRSLLQGTAGMAGILAIWDQVGLAGAFGRHHHRSARDQGNPGPRGHAQDPRRRTRLY